jgi:hypothetical protein
MRSFVLFIGFLVCLSQAALAVVHVSDYYRKDGTYVKAHSRSDPYTKRSPKTAVLAKKIKKEIPEKRRENHPLKKPLQFKPSAYSAEGEALY